MNRSVYFPSLFLFKRKKKNYCVYRAAIKVKKKNQKKKILPYIIRLAC